MEQPPRQRSRRSQELEPNKVNPQPQSDDALPPGTRYRDLPDGGRMIIQDNFKKEKGSY